MSASSPCYSQTRSARPITHATVCQCGIFQLELGLERPDEATHQAHWLFCLQRCREACSPCIPHRSHLHAAGSPALLRATESSQVHPATPRTSRHHEAPKAMRKPYQFYTPLRPGLVWRGCSSACRWCRWLKASRSHALPAPVGYHMTTPLGLRWCVQLWQRSGAVSILCACSLAIHALRRQAARSQLPGLSSTPSKSISDSPHHRYTRGRHPHRIDSRLPV